MTAPPNQQPELVVATYLTLMDQVRRALAGYLGLQWSALTSYRDLDASRFVDAIVPVVEASQRQAATLTEQYLGQVYGALTDDLPDLVGAGDLPSELRGVPAEELYQRPFKTIWRELSEGESLESAVEEGKRRLDNIAATDVTLAARLTSQETLQRLPKVVGYRRVLTGAENCGLCVVASTQRYHKADLLPIHPGCDCVVSPIVGDRDPGQVVNSAMLRDGAGSTVDGEGNTVYRGEDAIDVGELLEPVHDAIKKTFGKADRGGREIDYRKIMTVHRHGELGPVLSVKGHKFTGPAEVNRGRHSGSDKRSDDLRAARTQLRTLENMTPSSESAREYRRTQMDVLRRRIADLSA